MANGSGDEYQEGLERAEEEGAMAEGGGATVPRTVFTSQVLLSTLSNSSRPTFNAFYGAGNRLWAGGSAEAQHRWESACRGEPRVPGLVNWNRFGKLMLVFGRQGEDAGLRSGILHSEVAVATGTSGRVWSNQHPIGRDAWVVLPKRISQFLTLRHAYHGTAIASPPLQDVVTAHAEKEAGQVG